jgi:putative transposase
MMQMANNLIDAEEPCPWHTGSLIMDRDTKYSARVRAALARERVEAIRPLPRSPDLNAYGERFVRSIKEECAGHGFFGRLSLERALARLGICGRHGSKLKSKAQVTIAI